MAESFSVQGPVRIPKTAEHHKIAYHEQPRQKKEQPEDTRKSPFQKLMEKDESIVAGSKITPEQIFDRILPNCRRFIMNYDEIKGLFRREYPIALFFDKQTTEKDLLTPSYLSPEQVQSDAPSWQAMLEACRGHALLIHPQQWDKMTKDLEYAVMIATEARSVLAREYAQNVDFPDRICVSCVVGIDETGLSTCLFSTEKKYKRIGTTPEKLIKLRKARKIKSDYERKQEFIEKLRHQKRGLEKYRYDTAVMNRVKMTAKLFDEGAIRMSGKGQIKDITWPEDEISLSLMELITGGL